MYFFISSDMSMELFLFISFISVISFKKELCILSPWEELLHKNKKENISR